jgi:hypothetical protein
MTNVAHHGEDTAVHRKPRPSMRTTDRPATVRSPFGISRCAISSTSYSPSAGCSDVSHSRGRLTQAPATLPHAPQTLVWRAAAGGVKDAGSGIPE